MNHDARLQVVNLSCFRQQRCLFTNLSFSLNPHELLLVEGPNGAGKSSLLRVLTGLSTAYDGNILWQNTPIQNVHEDYCHGLHFIGHANGIKSGLTVLENLQLAKYRTLSTDMPDLDKILWELNLSAYKNTYASQLSAGQKRRIALAKLFLFPKKLWVIDEPFTSLDTETQKLFSAKLDEHLKQGGMAIISSHHAMPLTSGKIKTMRLG